MSGKLSCPLAGLRRAHCISEKRESLLKIDFISWRAEPPTVRVICSAQQFRFLPKRAQVHALARLAWEGNTANSDLASWPPLSNFSASVPRNEGEIPCKQTSCS
jgi:hypothetical protein